MNNIETDWKDEILSDEARYRIRNNNGDIVIDNASIDQITSVIQQGTPINKTNLKFPIGEIREFVDLRNDDKYLLCDGSTVKMTDYPYLGVPPLLTGTETLVREISHYGEIIEAFGKWYTVVSDSNTHLFYSTDFGANWVDTGIAIRYNISSNIMYDYRDGVLVVGSPTSNTIGKRLYISTDGINFSTLSTSADYWNNVAIYDGKVYASEYGSNDVKIYNPSTLELITTINFSNSIVTARGQLFSHGGMCAGNNCIYIETLSSSTYKLYKSTDGTNFEQVSSGSVALIPKGVRVDGNVYITNYKTSESGVNSYMCIVKANDNTYYGIDRSTVTGGGGEFRKKYYLLEDAINDINGIDMEPSGVLIQRLSDKYIMYDANMATSGNHTGSLYNIEDAKLPASGNNPKYIKVLY